MTDEPPQAPAEPEPPGELQDLGGTPNGVVDEDSREQVEQLNDVAVEDWRQDIELKRWYAKWALRGVAVQIVVANAVFIVYMVVVRGQVPDNVMIGWLTTTVVQVVGIALAGPSWLVGS